MIRRIILRHLSFVGKSVETAFLNFEDGVNVVYGASNTGKSFTAEALDFMLGASDPLPQDVEQLAGYSDALLGLTLPDLGDITLSRAITGGNFDLYEGLHVTKPEGVTPQKIGAKHQKANKETLSVLLLDLLGFDAREIVKNSATGEKIAFTFRGVAPFVLVKETAMLAPYGPAFSSKRKEAHEKSIFKTILTGLDDASIVPMVDLSISKAVVEGKVEIVDEIVAQIDENLGVDGPSVDQLKDQLENLDRELNGLEDLMKTRQSEVDQLAAARRRAFDMIADAGREVTELQLSVDRFTELNLVYDTDLRRLASIEEGGVVLLAMAARLCPFCGAEPEHQHHDHGLAEAQTSYAAARQEMAKISRDRILLASTTASLQAQIRGKIRLREDAERELREIEARLNLERPLETNIRGGFEALNAKRKNVSDRIDRLQERARLVARRESLIAEGKSAPKSLKLALGPSGPVGHELAQAIQGVLREWTYPGDIAVAFDQEAVDISVAGKLRTANGKGVRALLHAAFNVGLLIYCRQKGLPHPGFLVLDTPLLTYREPSKVARHGALEVDDQALRASTVKQKFFAHLQGLQDVQFLILENVDPPVDVDVATTFFSGEAGNGRVGLFPVA